MNTNTENTALTTRLTEMTDKAWDLLDSAPKESILLSEQAYALALEASDEYFTAKALRNIGAAHYRLSEYNLALPKLNEALKIFQKLDNHKQEIICGNLIGMIFLAIADYNNAMEYFIKNLELIGQTRNRKDEIDTMLRMGICYMRIGEYDKALDINQRSLQMAKEVNDERAVGALLSNIGNIYDSAKKDPARALQYYESAMEIFTKRKDRTNESNTLENMGISSFFLGRKKESEKYLIDALFIRKEMESKAGIARSHLNLGFFYLETGDYDKASSHLKESLEIAESINIKSILFENHLYLSRMYKKLGSFELALGHYEKFHEIQHQVFNENRDKITKSLQIRYEVEKMYGEKEIYRLKNKDLAEANRQITEQKEEIEARNKDITDSIRYARRIQEAILPRMEEIRKGVPEVFVMYKPKAIVSGDFYWYTRKGGKELLAVVDCTGHGVPGAFMSMIGNSLLNEIVNERGILMPGEILKHLDEGVRRALQQDRREAETRDGMDISLSMLDRAGGKLYYAGAMRPLYYVRNGELKELKGDKMSIGGLYTEGMEVQFHTYCVEVKKGDMFYMFSDGYVDQFGGGRGRKYLAKRFQEMLRLVSGKDIEEQEKEIQRSFMEWKGAEEQIDDVLVIGFRI